MRRPSFSRRPQRARLEASTAEAVSTVFEQLGDPVITSDAEGGRLVFNLRARELFGVPGTADPWATWEVSSADGRTTLAPAQLPLARALRGEELRDAEVQVRPPDGRARSFRVNARPLRDGRGVVVGAVVGLRDLTEAEHRAADLEARLTTLDHLPVAVMLVRAADGELVYLNKTWETTFGYDEAEALGSHISLVAPRGAREILRALEETGHWSGELETRRKDGTPLWTATEVCRYEHPTYGPVWVTVMADVTAERDERIARAEAAARWSAAFEDAPVGMAIIGPDLRMIDVNARLCALSGYPRHELIGASLATLAHPDDVAIDAEQAARLRAGELPRYRVDKRLRRPDGATVPVVITVSLVRAPDGSVMHELAVVAER